MKTIIAGSRNFHDYKTLLAAIEACPWSITSVVSGGAHGVDAMGEQFAEDSHLPLSLFPADWKKHGKAAGPIRNRLMAENAEALLALWDGKSRGTGNMVATAHELCLSVHVYAIPSPHARA